MLQRGEGDLEIEVLKQGLEVHLCTLVCAVCARIILHVLLPAKKKKEKKIVQCVVGVICAYVYTSAKMRTGLR